MTHFIGLAVPFNQPGRCWHPHYGVFEEEIRPMAFSRCRELSSGVPIYVNHDSADVVSDTSALWLADAGLFVRFPMKVCCQRRLLSDARGLSISFPFEDVTAEWRGHRQIVYRVPYIREISIVWRRQPVFAGTWLRADREEAA
jgi:phage head maturation protease